MKNLQDCAKFFLDGKIGVIPTDTIYGISASAFSPEAVEKIYKIKKRNLTKPCITLIGSYDDIEKLGLELTAEKKKILQKFWPACNSVILPCLKENLEYLHRGGKTLSVRFPDRQDLIKLLLKTGPLISTSTNPEGKKSAQNIQEAKEYFGNEVDFYFDGGELDGVHSTLMDFTGEKIKKIERK